MKIYRNSQQIYDLPIDGKTTIKRRLMVENSLDISIAVAKSAPLDLHIGDCVTLDGELYMMLDKPNRTLKNGVYQYDILMRGWLHWLELIMMPDMGRDEWFYYGSVVDHINKVVSALNTKNSGWVAIMPNVAELPSNEPKNINYANLTILSALHAICSQESGWGLEFDISGKVITFAREIKTPTELRFEYGCGKGLYELSEGALSGDKIATRVIAYGGSVNMASGVRLSMASVNNGNDYVESNVDLYGIRETRVNFDHIYPRRNSAITSDAVQVEAGKANWVVADSAMDFDINTQTVEKPVIMFNTGDCVGVEFEIVHYDPSTKVITFKESVDSGGAQDGSDYVMPNASRYPRSGDEYILVNILMPESYVAAAKVELLSAATAEAAKRSVPGRSYTVACDPRYIKQLESRPKVGDACRIVDAAHGVDYISRIVEINYPVVKPYDVDLVLSDKIPIPAAVVMAKSVSELKTKLSALDKGQVTEEYLRKIFHPLGGSLDRDFDAKHINASQGVTANRVA